MDSLCPDMPSQRQAPQRMALISRMPASTLEQT